MSARGAALAIGLTLLAPSLDAAETPAAGPSLSIGGAAHGCLQGAKPLPASGPGWQVLRPDHNRFWGNPALIGFLEDLAKTAEPFGSLQIGDMSLPRGGHMPNGHGSHQSGLDADILFHLMDHPLTETERDNPDFTSVLAGGTPSPERWGRPQATLLKTAAQDSRVERIFVNPAIKRYLCVMSNQDRGWLHKIRPWWGHEAHFHVRLACPAGVEGCEAGPPIPAGDGCDASLDWWFTAEATAPSPPPPGAPPRGRWLPTMPAACKSILDPKYLR